MDHIGIDNDQVIFYDVEGFILYEKVAGSFHHIEELCERVAVHGGVPVFFIVCLRDIDETGVNPA